MPRIGELRTRVTVLRGSTTRDDQGGFQSAEPLFVFEAWAEVKPKSFQSIFAASQLQSLDLYSVTLRERRDVQGGDFIRYEGTGGTRNLRVEAVVVNEERGVWTVLSCRQEVPGVLGHCD